MNCPNCDSPVDDGLFFCPSCGALLSQTSSSTPTTAPKAEPVITSKVEKAEFVPESASSMSAAPSVETSFSATSSTSTLQPTPTSKTMFANQSTSTETPAPSSAEGVEHAEASTLTDAPDTDAAPKTPRNPVPLVIGGVGVAIVVIFVVCFFVIPWRTPSSSVTTTEQVVETDSSSVNSSSGSTSDTSNSSDIANGTALSQAQNNGDYVLADSNTRYYAESELTSMSDYQLYIARNEIYARHGRGFKTPELQNYFNGKSWYEMRYSPEQFEAMDSPLNDYERKNADLMLKIEKSRNSPYLS